jgi:membrane protein
MMNKIPVVKDFIKEVYKIWIVKRPTQLAAALAYYGVFSFAPVIYLAFLVAGIFINEASVADRFYTRMEAVLGAEIAIFIQNAVVALSNASTGNSIIISIISFLALLYAASGIFFQLQYALNSIWQTSVSDQEITRAFLRQRLFSFLMVIALGLLVIVITVVNVVLVWFGSVIEIFLPTSGWLTFLNFIVLIGVIILAIAFMYKVLPEVRISWRDVWPGAVLTTVLMVLGGLLFGLYFQLGGFGSALEAAGTFAVLLIAIYTFAQIFLFGAVFTRAYAYRYGSLRQQS